MISKLSKVSQSASQIFSKRVFLKLYERIRWKNLSRKLRALFLVLITVIPAIAITLGILLSCIHNVDYHSFGVALNRSTQRFEGDTYSNKVIFLSPASVMKTFPSGFFQMSFSDQHVQGIANYPSIRVRTLQGTPLNVNTFITGRLNVTDSKNLFRKYGDNWMDYLRFQIPNAIVRSVSNIGFYELSSAQVKSLSASVLNSFDEFNINIVNIKIQLPIEFLSNVNGTIGWEIFQNQAQLILLNQSLSQLTTYGQSNALISGDYTEYGRLLAQRDSQILNNSFATDSTGSYYWQLGTGSLNNITTNTTLYNYTLWYYFQSYYNSSFNPYPHQIQFN